MSKPTVSHHIKMLEQEMGVELFIRTNTGLELTEGGKVLLPWVRCLLHVTNIVQAMMSSLQNDIVGELRIACSTTVGKYVLPQLAARLCQQFPNLDCCIAFLSFKQRAEAGHGTSINDFGGFQGGQINRCHG